MIIKNKNFKFQEFLINFHLDNLLESSKIIKNYLILILNYFFSLPIINFIINLVIVMDQKIMIN